MTPVMREDCAELASNESVPWSAFAGATIVITGATGLIGQTLVGAFLAREELCLTGTRVIALVRNLQKGHRLFGSHSGLQFITWDATAPQQGLEQIEHADYVFHCANMTDSAAFVNNPVEVIQTTVGGAEAMLQLAQRTGARLCLLSTMETYGEVMSQEPLKEGQGGFLDAMLVRNSYPEAKRLDEALVAAYVSEYGVQAVVARLTQTFGPGVAKDDGRVFAYFARCACNGEDIVMLTKGTKQNAYLYTADAVSALLCIASKGEAGRAYNVANNTTFCEVRQMAQLVADSFGGRETAVRFEIDEEAAQRFRKGSMLRLDTTALRGLGWKPRVGLKDMYARMMEDWESSPQSMA